MSDGFTFDTVKITYMDGALQMIACDTIRLTDEGWLMLLRGEIITALVPAQHVRVAELFEGGRRVGNAGAEAAG
jgi:hypothetical protein